ncbi:hypothetical protein GCM10010510_37710 [Streptomyces anandii JCM 4720]|nr:hypothetical protein GCM10010510_37710 [Streptomyces anandii JCM 4720]
MHRAGHGQGSCRTGTPARCLRFVAETAAVRRTTRAPPGEAAVAEGSGQEGAGKPSTGPPEGRAIPGPARTSGDLGTSVDGTFRYAFARTSTTSAVSATGDRVDVR